MTLEEYIAHLNMLAFWNEFTFDQNKFAPQPGREFELADNIVWLWDHAYVLQLKERTNPTENPEAETTWFNKKVLGKATSQVRDSMRFLNEHETVRVVNRLGHDFEIKGADLKEIIKIVVFLASPALPEDCWAKRYHISDAAGFIHILPAHDYLGVLEKLRVPEDIRRYFNYRENVLPKLAEMQARVDEADIMGAFLEDIEMPTSETRESLRRFVQDLDSFDLSRLLGGLREHIHQPEPSRDYYRIMLEFARVPRSVWREIKLRFMKSLESVKQAKACQPFRLSFPEADCTFMIAPLDPAAPSTGVQGEKLRVTGLRNLTYGAMYDAKTSKGVGILISRDGEYFQIDWCLIERPWEVDSEMDRMLAENNPFRAAKERMVDGFYFRQEN